MRFHKTPRNQRTIYRLYDDHGKIIATFDPETDTTLDVSVDAKKELVRVMHSMDDAEVRRNLKERRLDPFSQQQYDELKEDFIKEFRRKHGRAPRKEELPEGGHRSFFYLDAQETDSNSEDKTPEAFALSSDPFNEDYSPIDCMEELLLTDLFNDRERTVYNCKIRLQMSDKDTGTVIGTSGQYAGRIWRGVQEKIKNCPAIRKYYRM